MYKQDPLIPVSPATLFSNSLSYKGKAPKSQSCRQYSPQRPSHHPLLYRQRPRNPILAGGTSLKLPLLCTQHPETAKWPATLASNSLSHIGKAPKSRSRRRDLAQAACPIQARPRNPSPAGETGLKQPLLYREGPKFPCSAARLAFNSLPYIGKTPKAQLHRRDELETAAHI